jgi:hypothetical protein
VDVDPFRLKFVRGKVSVISVALDDGELDIVPKLKT